MPTVIDSVFEGCKQLDTSVLFECSSNGLLVLLLSVVYYVQRFCLEPELANQLLGAKLEEGVSYLNEDDKVAITKAQQEVAGLLLMITFLGFIERCVDIPGYSFVKLTCLCVMIPHLYRLAKILDKNRELLDQEFDMKTGPDTSVQMPLYQAWTIGLRDGVGVDSLDNYHNRVDLHQNAVRSIAVTGLSDCLPSTVLANRLKEPLQRVGMFAQGTVRHLCQTLIGQNP